MVLPNNQLVLVVASFSGWSVSRKALGNTEKASINVSNGVLLNLLLRIQRRLSVERNLKMAKLLL